MQKEILEISPEQRNRIRTVLKEVERLSGVHRNLDNFGISTMKQAIEIMEAGRKASPLVAEALLATPSSNFRYWLIDILGYLKDDRNLFPLFAVLENENEKRPFRERALESAKEIGGKQVRKMLLDSYSRIDDKNLREKIARVIAELSN
ncbi:MAG TPA: HEAT repeat domain-containing protein [bacterium]|nr:HEAT repeat domain-containing protein [bacterium]